MQDREWPLVTVFALVYNTGKYVVEALASVKANNYPNLQHIIIDDYSTDGESVQIVEKWIRENNYECLFIKHEVNQGICKSLNEILQLAKGEYMLGVSDDLITPGRIKEHVLIFEKANENVALVFSDVAVINKDNKVIETSMFKSVKEKFGRVPEGRVYQELLINNFIPGIGVTMRVSSLKKVGGFDETLYFEDWDMWLRLSRNHDFIKNDNIGGYYRRHTESAWSQRDVRIFEGCLKTLDKNVNDKKSKKIIANQYFVFAEMYYKMNGKKPYRYFGKSLLLKWELKRFLFFVISFLGLPYSTINTWRGNSLDNQ